MVAFVLTPGEDHDSGSANQFNVFFFTPGTLQSNDTIVGGATVADIAALTAGGTLDAAQFSGLSGLEQLRLSGSGNTVTLPDSLLASSSTGFFTVYDGSAPDWSLVSIGDTNGDHRADLIWRSKFGGIAAVNGLNDAMSLSSLNGAIGADWNLMGVEWHLLANADFNGDAKSDILWQSDSGMVAIWQLDGNRVVGGGQIGNISPDWHFAATADFNGDARNDILWRNNDGTVVVWQINNSQLQTIATVGSASNDYHIIGTADFNGDARADILFRNDNGEVVVWQMNGTQLQTAATAGTASNDYRIVGTADFNGDARADILFRNDVNGAVVVWQMNGTQLQSAVTVGSAGLDTHILGTGDFNGDGRADILFENDVGQVSIWQMNGTQIQSIGSPGSVGAGWHFQAIADFNGDGRSDILWHNDDGALSIWTMNGTAVQVIQTVPTNGNDVIDASAATAAHSVHTFIGGGSDTFIGGAADDQVLTPNSNFASIDGGGGNDRLTLTTPGQVFNLTANASKIHNTEVLWLDDTPNTDVTLAGSDIPQISGTFNYLYVVGGPDDHVQAGDGYGVFALNVTNNAIAPGHTFTDYQHISGAHLFVDNAINLDIVAGPTIPVDTDAAVNAVTEGSPTGTPVGIDVASNDPGGNPVVFSLSNDAGGRFAINPATGVVTVANAGLVDFETAPGHVYGITVRATAGIGFSQQNFTIAVGDVAPTQPSDSNGVSGGSIAEGIAAGSAVGITVASTDVNGSGGLLRYALTGGDVGLFDIDPVTGVVTVKSGAVINYETTPGHAYSITAQATDGSLTSATQTFAIAVTNVAPSTPVDSDAASLNAVTEGNASGTYTGLTVFATDPASAGSQVTYSFDGTAPGGGNAGGRFAIDAATGVVTIANAALIDYETAPSHAYSITVIASDNAGGANTLTSTQTFTIAVANANPSLPADSDTAAANTVTEGVASGVYTGVQAAATDPGGTTLSYSLTDSAGGRFTIDAVTGRVSTGPNANLIDFESAPSHSYIVTVQAADGGGGLSSQLFAIGVADVIPTQPTDGNAGPETVVEGATTGTLVGITASSTDVNGGTVTYRFFQPDPVNQPGVVDDGGGRFAINAQTGEVSVSAFGAANIDYETAPGHAYSITVEAFDGTLASAPQTFSIAVTNAAPSTPADSDTTTANGVTEGAATGTYSGLTAASTDANSPSSTVTYSLTDNAGGRFAINSTTGAVTVGANANLIDFETAAGNAYSITVAATDGTTSTTQSFSIAVANAAPTVPVDGDATANTVTEGVGSGIYTGFQASATDPGGTAVTYALTDDAGGRFVINGTTGQVSTGTNASLIDYETAPGVGHTYSITVQASDTAGATSSQTFAIPVADAPPANWSDASNAPDTVVEGAANGTAIGITAHAVDPNGGNVTYSLVTNPGNAFTINATSGVISVANGAAIDFEGTAPNHTYTITVQGTDDNGLSTTSDFVVNVTNAAPGPITDTDATAGANAAEGTITEGALQNAAVGITAHSDDPGGGTITYTLSNSAGGLFAIDANGIVSVSLAGQTGINYEGSGAGHSYTITVDASDGTTTVTKNFTIAVTNAPPSAPTDSDSGTANVVNVTANPGDTVGVTASSADPNGGAVTYAFADLGGGLLGDADGRFNINPTTGVVTVKAGHPAFAPATNYDIHVIASDGGPGGTGAESVFTIFAANNLLNVDLDLNGSTVAGAAGNDASATFTEQGSAASVGDTDVTITNTGNPGVTNATSATIVLTNAQLGDDFTFTGAAPGGIVRTVTTSAGKITVTLTGTASYANYETAIEQIQFTTTGDPTANAPNPTDRLINVTVSDATGTSPIAHATIHVTPVNDAPALAPTPTVTDVSYTENDGPLGLFAAGTVADPDHAPNFSGGSFTATITNAVAGEDHLGLLGGTNFSASGATLLHNGAVVGTLTGLGTASVSVTLTAAATPTVVNELAHAFGYYNSSENPSTADRSVSFTFNDGGHTGTGALSSNTVTQVVHVAAVDDTPTAVNDTATVDEDDAATAIAVLTNDTDPDGGPTSILSRTNGAHGTVVITGGGTGLTYQPAPNYFGPDSFTYTLSSGSTATVNVTVTEVNDAPVAVDDVAPPSAEDAARLFTFASLTGNDSAGPANESGQALTITGTSNVIGGTITTVGTNLVFTPTPDFNGAASFDYTVADDGTGTPTDTGHVSFTITAENDAPVLANINGNTAAFTEQGGAVPLDVGSDAALTDIDSADFDTGTVTVSITGNGVPSEDVLGIQTTAQISTAGSAVSYNGTQIGTFTGGTGADLVITLDADATPAAVQALVRALTYDNTNTGTPSALTRAVAITVTDGDGGSTAVNTSVTVADVNDAPVLAPTSPAAVSYTENGAAVQLFATGTVSDADAPASFLGGGFTVEITNPAPPGAGDDIVVLGTSGFTLSDDGLGGFSLLNAGHTIGAINFGHGTAIVTDLTAFATPAIVNQLVEAFAYRNTTENPDITSRTVSFTFNDGGHTGGAALPSNTVTQTITVTAVNDAPVNTVPLEAQVTPVDTTIEFVGGGTNEIRISDLDVQGNDVTVTLSVDHGTLSVSAALSAALTSISGDGTATLTLVGTTGAINDALGGDGITEPGLTYTPDSGYTGTDSLTITTDDGGNTGTDPGLTGTATSEADTDVVHIAVTAAGAGNPDVDLNGGDAGKDFTAAFTEGGAAVSIVGAGVTIVDTDGGDTTDAIASATITLVNHQANDVLVVNIAGLPTGITASTYNAATGVLTLTSAATNTAAQYQTALQQITFDSPGGDPSPANRTITVSVNDGAADSNTAVTTITVTAENDIPTLDLDLGGTGTGFATAYTENGTPAAIADTDVTIVDPDNTTLDHVTITLANPQTNDLLSFNGPLPAGITALSPYNSVTGELVLTNTNPFGSTIADFQTALRQVVFSNQSENPDTTARTITVTVNDGTADSLAATTTITVTAADDAPTAVNDTTTVAEDAAATAIPVLTNDTDPDGGPKTISAASDPAHGTVVLTGGVAGAATGLTYQPDADYFGADSFTYTLNGGSTATVNVTVAEVNDALVAVDDTPASSPEDTARLFTFAALTANDSTGATNEAGQTLTITGTSNVIGGTITTVGTSLVFTPTADFVGTAEFDYTVQDNGTTNGVADPKTDTGHVSFTVTAVNDAPVLANINGDTAAFTEQAGAVLLDVGSNATLTDIDSADFNTGTVTVSITGNGVPGEDVLGIQNQGTGAGQIGMSVTDVTFGGIVIGTFTGGTGTDLVITLDADATPAAVQALVRALTYDNSNTGNPSALTRAVAITVTDGDGGSTAVNTSVTVADVNDAPVLDLDGSVGGNDFSTTYTISTSGRPIADTDVAISDADDTTITGATVTLTNGLAGDHLGISGVLPSSIAAVVTGTAPGVITVTLSGTASLAAYQAALQQIVFSNGDSASNNTTDRHVTVVLSDGHLANNTSATHTTTIDVVQDSAPVAADDSGSGAKNAGNIIGVATTNDTDAQDPASALVVTTVRTGTELSGTGTSGVVGNALVGSFGALTLNFDGTYTYQIDVNNATVQTLTTGNHLFDVFTYTVRDAAGLTDQAQITIDILGANGPPTANPDAVSATEAGGIGNGTAGVNPTGNVVTANDTDPDGNTLSVVGVAGGTQAGPLSGNVGGGVTNGSNFGTLTIASNGAYTYVVNNANTTVQTLRTSAQTLTDTFSYTVQDPDGLNSTTQVTVTIHGQNDNPVAVADTGTATEAGGTNNGTGGANASGDVLANDTDADSAVNGETKEVQGVEAGSHIGDTVTTGVGTGILSENGYGTLTVNTNGSFSYAVNNANTTVQALNVGGQAFDVFTYTVHDAAGATSTGILTITINGANDAPTANADGTPTPITVIENRTTAPTANLVTNDTDPENATLTAVKDTNTVHGGTVTVNADGTFSVTYAANSNYLGADTFTYHVTDPDPDGGGAATSLSSNSATVTLEVQPLVWYIDDSVGAVNDATHFTTIAAFNTANAAASATGRPDIVYIRNGDDGIYTTADGVNLRDGQTLLGQGVDLTYTKTLGGTGVIEDHNGETPTIVVTSSTGQGVTLAQNNNLAGFNIQTNDASAIGIEDSNAAGTAGAVGNLTISGVAISGVGKAVDIDQGGTLNVHLASVTSTGSNTEGVQLGGIAGALLGGSFTVDGTTSITNADTNAIQVSNTAASAAFSFGTSTTINDTAIGTGHNGNGINLTTAIGATNTFGFGNLGVTTDGGYGLTANAAGTITFGAGPNTINATGGAAVDITGTALANATFSSVSSSGSSTYGINLVNQTSGTFTANGGTIGTADTAGVRISGGTAAATIGSAINSSNGEAVDISGHSTGTITLSGAIAHTANTDVGINVVNNTGGNINFTGQTAITTTTANAVNLTGNSGATIDFNAGGNGLDINTSSGTGFNATGTGPAATTGGTVTVQGTGNSINSTGGTALNIVNTTIGANDVTFQSISSGASGTAGIILDNTGSSGGLHVTGNGATIGASGGGVIGSKTGGDVTSVNGDGTFSISGTSGVGIFLRSTGDVQLNGIQLNDFSNFAILGSNVNGIAFNHLNVSGASGSNASLNEGAIAFQQLTGTGLTFDNSTINGGLVRNVSLINTSGTLNRITFTNDTFGQDNATLGSDALFIQGRNNATVNATVTGSTFNGSRGDMLQFDLTDTAAGNIQLLNSTLHNTANSVVGGGGVTFSGGGSTGAAPTMTYTVSGNSFTGARGDMLLVVMQTGHGSASGSITNNTFGVAATDKSGSAEGSDIDIRTVGGAAQTVLINNNQIHQYANSGILLQVGDQNVVGTTSPPGALNATVSNNVVDTPNSAAATKSGISLNAGTTNGDSYQVFLNLFGNNAPNSGSTDASAGSDYILRQRMATTIHLSANGVNYSGANNDNTAVATFVQNNNTGTETVFVSNSVGGAAPNSGGGFVGGAPSLPLLASSGGVQSASGSAGVTQLTQAELDPVVQSAIAHWAAAGATAAQLAALHATVVTVTDLPDDVIGQQTSGRIEIDVGAAGYGWFVDPTPGDNAEFPHAINAAGTDLLTDPTQAAAGHMDLLTTVMHEMGHVLGLQDLTSVQDIADLMSIGLVTGERRLPDAADVTQANEAMLPLSAQAPTGTPIITGTSGNDILVAGHGANILAGGPGADLFVIELVPAAGAATHIADYDVMQGDAIDLSAILSVPVGIKAADPALVRAHEDGSGTFATLQLNTDPAHGDHWTDIAQLDGVRAGDAINVMIDATHAVHQIHADWLV